MTKKAGDFDRWLGVLCNSRFLLDQADRKDRKQEGNKRVHLKQIKESEVKFRTLFEGAYVVIIFVN